MQIRNNLAKFALKERMEAKEIQHLYAQHPGVEALLQLMNEGSKKPVLLEGLLGSSAAMVLCGLKERAPGQTFLVVMNDAEEAGYFYHDLTQIAGESNILFFPSSFISADKKFSIHVALFSRASLNICA